MWPVSAVYPHRRSALFRCHECHGPIVLMQESKDGRNAAHFEHKPSHAGCSLVHRYYSGIGSLHPNAVRDPARSTQLAFADYISDRAAEEIIGPVSATEKERLLLARVGQGSYRKKLVARWGTCSVLGCGPETTLIASHIVPWRECETNDERLDLDNGLLLSPNLDKLFDRKLISFSDTGALLVSPALAPADASALGIRQEMRLRKIPPGLIKYLARHREGIQWITRIIADAHFP